MSYYPPTAGFGNPPPFAGAAYDSYMPSAGYPPSQGPLQMPEPFSGGMAPSYPVSGPTSALPYPPQPFGYTAPSQPAVAMPSYESSLTGAYPSYPPQHSTHTSLAPMYPPNIGPSPVNYPPGPTNYPPGPTNYPPGPANYHPGPANYPPGPVSTGLYPAVPAPSAYAGVAATHAVASAYPTTAAPVAMGATFAQGHGTVRMNPAFNAEEDSKVLRKAMKGFGTDERAIIELLGRRANSQRQQIRMLYKTMYGRDLLNDLSSELSFRFKQTVLAVMMTPAEYDAEQIHKAIRGLGTDEETLVEILCSRTNQQIHEIKSVYKTVYHKDLERDLVGDTSGHFRRLVVSLSTGGRREDGYIDIEKARRDAMELYQAGERRWGTDESKFNQILCSQSHAQLRVVFEEYKRLAHRSLEQSIKSEMSGDLEMGMLAIVSVVQNPRRYFAERLHRSMKGLGTNDDILIRVVVSRSEVDMVEIKQEFQHMYGQTVEAFIESDTSGDYRKMLMILVRGF